MNNVLQKGGIAYLDKICTDDRLNVWHLCLLLAIVRLAYRQNENIVIRVSRSMAATEGMRGK